MGKKMKVVMQSVYRQKDADSFQDCVDYWLEQGGEIVSSGAYSVPGAQVLWVMLTLSEKPEEEPTEHKSEVWDWLEQKVLERYRKESANDFGLSEVEHAWQMALDYVQEARRRAGR